MVPVWQGRANKPTHYHHLHNTQTNKPIPPGIDPLVGDWLCPCGNWNWARRGNCNKCGAPKPR